MTLPLSRRRLIQTTLVGLPLLAACTDGSQTLGTVLDHAAFPANAGASPAAAGSPSSTAVPAPVPQAAPTAARIPTVILDPGHGQEEIGAASSIPGLPSLAEKDSNLAFGWRLRELLEGDGIRVLMTREADTRAFGFVAPLNPSTVPGGMSVARADLQARVDFANRNAGDLFLSLHSNDSGTPGENGMEAWYCGDREVGDLNGIWAQLVLDNVLSSLAQYGYRPNNRGIKEDRYFRVRNGQNFHLFILGPANPGANHPRATLPPSALIENLFMRHERDIRVLRDPTAREYIAQGMRRAVNQWFERRDG